MYHEFGSGTKRSGWVFPYLGKELLPYARERLSYYIFKETVAREQVSTLMLDKTVPANDQRISQARSDVETYGSLHEQLDVWVHEFARLPDREYLLSLGDVVFFGLIIPEADLGLT